MKDHKYYVENDVNIAHYQANTFQLQQSLCSMVCEFCTLLKQRKQQLLYIDEEYFAFNDIDLATAQAHVLVCPVEHIETAEEIKDARIFRKMQQIGRKVLDRFCEERKLSKTYRFGFHLRPYNSIDHVHLHCFVLPFQSFIKDKGPYGKMMVSIEDVVRRVSPKL